MPTFYKKTSDRVRPRAVRSACKLPTRDGGYANRAYAGRGSAAQLGESRRHAAARRFLARLLFLMLAQALAVIAVAALLRFRARLRCAVGQAHGQRDAFALLVHFQHFHPDHLAGLDDAVRILDEGVR